MVRSKDWSGLAIPVSEGIFFLVLICVVAIYRWLLHRRRVAEVDRQVTHWCAAILPTFRSLPLNEQLGSISLLGDLSGHPAYVVQRLVGLRVAFETVDVHPSILAVLDGLAEERQRQGRRTPKEAGARKSRPIDS